MCLWTIQNNNNQTPNDSSNQLRSITRWTKVRQFGIAEIEQHQLNYFDNIQWEIAIQLSSIWLDRDIILSKIVRRNSRATTNSWPIYERWHIHRSYISHNEWTKKHIGDKNLIKKKKQSVLILSFLETMITCHIVRLHAFNQHHWIRF